ncbi:MAG: cation diffusion facilitator family transporter [Gammaproteobacteria bacterium]|nr:cation diffusion facilitator family transporter [Gammaproteobacteria bacterium]
MSSVPSNPELQARLLRLATWASLATALVLIAAKLGGWWLTDAVSLLASLLDSSADLVASLLTFLAVRWSLVPPDHDHRFGHGKAEALAALAQSMFILGSAVMLALQGFDRLIHPQPLKQSDIGLAVMVFSIVLTLALVTFQYSVAQRTGSTVIRADALHYVTDLLSGMAVIAALLLSQWGFLRADAIIGLLIAAYVARSAIQIARDGLDQLMDRELPAAIGEQVRALVLGVPGVRGIASLRTRQSGSIYFFEVYVVLDDAIPLKAAHDIGDEVRAAIQDAFPGADIVIHEEPASALGPNAPSAAQ